MKIKLSALFLLYCGIIFSQSPQVINYQGVARDALGAPLNGNSIGLRFELLQGSATGSVVYTEQQTVSTNSSGLFSTQIGKNSRLAVLNWQVRTYSLRVSVDILGGNNYVEVGTQQLTSVPYSFRSEYSENTK